MGKIGAGRGGSDDPLFIMVAGALGEQGLLPPGGGVVVGVSGGADSVCLLHILSVYFSSQTDRLVAVHVNHMLRGGEADRDEEHVKRLCDSLDVRLICVSEDARAYATAAKMSVEAAAREVRYRALERERRTLEAETGKAWRIAVAHNRDDLAETVLMNILRGTSVDGLVGMTKKNKTDPEHFTLRFTPILSLRPLSRNPPNYADFQQIIENCY